LREVRFEGPARRRASAVLDRNLELFAAAGYGDVERLGPLEARVAGPSRPPLRLRMAQEGRVFGGTYALEVSTAKPVLERSGGLRARGKGLVTLRSVRFRARRGDAAGRRLAERLEQDAHLAQRLAAVHFERIAIEPDGSPVIRHMGGSLVWILFPPLVKSVPLVLEQAKATILALEAFVSPRDGAGRDPAPSRLQP
jgi:hypothetical protein